MTGAVDGGIISNRDTPVPQANDIGFHVALENGRKTEALLETGPRSRLGRMRRIIGG